MGTPEGTREALLNFVSVWIDGTPGTYLFQRNLSDPGADPGFTLEAAGDGTRMERSPGAGEDKAQLGFF